MAHPAHSPDPPRPARAGLVGDLAARLTGGGPRGTVLNAPRGWGKRETLSDVARLLAAGGEPFAEIDLSDSPLHPGEFACTFASSCVESLLPPSGSRLRGMAGGPPPEARLRALARSDRIEAVPGAARALEEILALLESGSGAGGTLVRRALDLPRLLARSAGPPFGLILHAVDEVLSLAPYPALRGIPLLLAEAISAEPLRFLASISPGGRPAPLVEALRALLGEDLRVEDLPPLHEEEVRGLLARGPEPAEGTRTLLAVSGGRLLTLRLLAGHLAGGRPLEETLADAMAPGEGRLYQELRFDYHMLIEKTRGNASCRAVLGLLAREEGLDLSGIASRLRRTPGSTLDVLRWLTEVSLLRREGRRYRFADPLLRLYVILHVLPERPDTPTGRLLAVRRFLAGLDAPPVPLNPLGRPRLSRDRQAPPRPAGAQPPAAARRPARRGAPPAPEAEDLMEID